MYMLYLSIDILLCMNIQLILEQHECELHGFTDLQIFFRKYTSSQPYPQVLHLQIRPTADRKQYFQFMVGNLQVQRANWMRHPMSFYVKHMGHSWISLVSTGTPRTNHP